MFVERILVKNVVITQNTLKTAKVIKLVQEHRTPEYRKLSDTSDFLVLKRQSK